MRVLVACEKSQTVCLAFRKFGHEAYSCDIQDCSGGHPEWHIKCDVIDHLNSVEPFFYDLIIAHPPCTYLSAAGACRFYHLDANCNSIIDIERFKLQFAAREFFMFFYNYPYCKRICIENPRPMKSAALPPYSQVIQPYDFGDSFSKQTLLWLKGLPYLLPDCIVYDRRAAFSSWTSIYHNVEIRSKTFPGIARAMATQWSF